MSGQFNESNDAEPDPPRERREFSKDEFDRVIQAAEVSRTTWGAMRGRDRAMLYLTGGATGFDDTDLACLKLESFNLDSDPPTVTVAAPYGKRRCDDVRKIPRDVAERLRPWLTRQPRDDFLFVVPYDSGAMLRADQAAAREAWLNAAPDANERAEREKSDFLCVAVSDKPPDRADYVTRFKEAFDLWRWFVWAGEEELEEKWGYSDPPGAGMKVTRIERVTGDNGEMVEQRVEWPEGVAEYESDWKRFLENKRVRADNAIDLSRLCDDAPFLLSDHGQTPLEDFDDDAECLRNDVAEAIILLQEVEPYQLTPDDDDSDLMASFFEEVFSWSYDASNRLFHYLIDHPFHRLRRLNLPGAPCKPDWPFDLIAVGGFGVAEALQELDKLRLWLDGHIAAGDAKTIEHADARPIDPNAMLAPRDLARRYKRPQSAVEKALQRWRAKNPSRSPRDWLEVSDRGPRDPQFLYRVGALEPVILGIKCRANVRRKKTPSRRTGV
jgi:hypothetical protein